MSNPTRANKYYWSQLVSEVGCIACRVNGIFNTHVSIHHIDGRTKPGAHDNVLPLCHAHHQGGCEADPSIHPWKKRFEDRYGSQEALKVLCDSFLLDKGLIK
ncbi:MAG: Ref family recombination enhancement nuclease [Thiobacillus sp.]